MQLNEKFKYLIPLIVFFIVCQAPAFANNELISISGVMTLKDFFTKFNEQYCINNQKVLIARYNPNDPRYNIDYSMLTVEVNYNNCHFETVLNEVESYIKKKYDPEYCHWKVGNTIVAARYYPNPFYSIKYVKLKYISTSKMCKIINKYNNKAKIDYDSSGIFYNSNFHEITKLIEKYDVELTDTNENLLKFIHKQNELK